MLSKPGTPWFLSEIQIYEEKGKTQKAKGRIPGSNSLPSALCVLPFI